MIKIRKWFSQKRLKAAILHPESTGHSKENKSHSDSGLNLAIALASDALYA